MTKPTMQTALENKGFVQRNVQFQIAITKYQNAGGEFGVAYAMLCAAFGKGDGQRALGEDAQPIRAVTPGRGADHSKPGATPDSLSSASRPGRSKRGRSAIASIQPAIAKSLFDSIVLPDGRPLREVRWSECPALAGRYQKLARILWACRNFAVPVDPASSLADVVPEKELKTIVEAAEKLNAIN